MRSIILILLWMLSEVSLKAQALQDSFNNHTTYVFIGSYTNNKPDKGIYIYKLDTATGELTFCANGNDITNPSYITLSNNGKYIYACTETKMKGEGSVSSFTFDSISGSIQFINKQPSGGENPVYLTTNETDEWLINANYGGGSISVFPLGKDGGIEKQCGHHAYISHSSNPERQEASHIHSVVFSPKQDYLIAADLGSDLILARSFNKLIGSPLYDYNSIDFRTPPGTGPRHLTFHPSGNFAYCTYELSGQIQAFSYQKGTLKPIQLVASYSQKQESYASSDIHISPEGKFLYATNREDEHSISIFAIDEQTGKLKLVGHQTTMGKHPRMFAIDPSGKWLIVANQLSNTIQVFQRNAETGLLTHCGTNLKIPRPSCVQIRNYEH